MSLDAPAASLDGREFHRVLKRATVGLGLALGLPALVLLGLVLILLRAAHWVDHTDRVIAQTNAIQRQLLEMQTSFRGYRLSDDESHLRAFDRVHKANAQAWSGLTERVSDSAGQVASVAASRQAADAWIDFVGDEVETVRGRPELVRDPGFLARGVPLFDGALARLDKVAAEEARLLEVRDGKLQLAITALLTAFGIGVLAGIPVLAVWLRRLLRKVSATYRANAEAAERRARELAVTLSSIGDAVVATDAEGRVNFLNPAAEQLTGWPTGEARGCPLPEVFAIFNEQTLARTENPVERVLRENCIVGLANHTVLRSRDGREIPIEDSAAPIRGERGEVLGVILVFHDVTEKRQSERTLEQNERRFRFLNELGEATRPLFDPEEIMDQTTRMLGEQLEASRCVYMEMEEDSDRLMILRDYTDGCISLAGPHRLSTYGALTFHALEAGETVLLRDMEAEISDEEARETYRAAEIRAMICCPVRKGGRLRALMAVHQNRPRNWTADEISLMEEVAERCWAVIERARAEQDSRERNALSNLRADMAAALDVAVPIGETLQKCCELIMTHLDAAFARVWLLNEETNTLELRASAGLYTHLDGPHGRVPVGQFKIGRIAASGKPHLTNDVPHDPNVSDQEWARREGMQAFAGYPLLVEGKVLGVVALFARQPLSPAVIGDLAPISDAIAQQIQRKYAETALLASETLKSAILETAIDGFVLMDHEGRVLDWNPAAESITGYRRSEAMGQLLGELIVPENLRERHRQGLAHYVATRERRIMGQRLELPAMRKDGTQILSEVAFTHTPGTEPPVFAGYLRDITSRKANEEALIAATARAEASAHAVAESAERFHLLSEISALQVWTARPDGGLDFVNAEGENYLGGDAESDILGEGWMQFVHPEDAPAASEAWRRSIDTGETYTQEFRLRGTDEAYRWFLVRAEALRDESGQILKWFGTNTDVHELKLALAETERASRAKDDFMAVLSHELRTPLTPVLMAAAALREDERLPQEVRSQMAMMERNIGLEARLIDDLLDITRIAKGKLPLRPQLCDAHSLISLAIEIVRDEAQTKGITLAQNFEAECSGLMADPSRFQQVIWNLLRNAVKFTPRSGAITISTSDVTRDGGEPTLAIEIRDSGIGIEPEAIERIFQPFEQVGLTGDHRYGGIGLGLAIARAIVDLHGGTIRAESEGTGQGSVFVVELPGATSPPAGTVETSEDAESFLRGMAPEGPPKPREPSLDLLLVEDHGPTLQVLERLLRRAGHRVATASSVADALTIAGQAKFDLVISDLGLPDGTGNELMAKLRDRHGLRGIALTGYGMEEDLERSRQAGFALHLIKPIEFNQLRRALATVQSESAAEQ